MYVKNDENLAMLKKIFLPFGDQGYVNELCNPWQQFVLELPSSKFVIPKYLLRRLDVQADRARGLSIAELARIHKLFRQQIYRYLKAQDSANDIRFKKFFPQHLHRQILVALGGRTIYITTMMENKLKDENGIASSGRMRRSTYEKHKKILAYYRANYSARQIAIKLADDHYLNPHLLIASLHYVYGVIHKYYPTHSRGLRDNARITAREFRKNERQAVKDLGKLTPE